MIWTSIWKAPYLSPGIRSQMRNSELLSFTNVSNTCLQAVGTTHSGSDQKQQLAPVPTGQQRGFGSAKTHWKHWKSLRLAWCRHGAWSASVCTRERKRESNRHVGCPKHTKKGLSNRGASASRWSQASLFLGSMGKPRSKLWERGVLVQTNKAISKTLTLPPWAACALRAHIHW